MSGDKYGFGGGQRGGIALPKISSKPKSHVAQDALTGAIKAGEALGFVARGAAPEAEQRRKPGPRRVEAQGKVGIVGPQRVIDAFRAFCDQEDVTLWEGLERLLQERAESSG
mgnify:CR=1 FL=1